MKIKMLILVLILFSTLVHSQNDIFGICRKGTVEDISALYSKIPNSINIRSEKGYLPLTLACYHGNEEVVEFLVTRVNSINGSNSYGSPLMAAVVKGNINIVNMLLNNKADTNVADVNGTTALHYAVIFNQVETVKLLVNAGANIYFMDNRDQSAVDYATIKNNKQIITLLNN